MAKTVRMADARWRLVLRAVDEVLNTEADGPPYMTALDVAELFEARALIACAKEEEEGDGTDEEE